MIVRDYQFNYLGTVVSWAGSLYCTVRVSFQQYDSTTSRWPQSQV